MESIFTSSLTGPAPATKKALAKAGLTMDEILRTVGKSFGVDVKDLRSKGRRQELVAPRQLAMYLIREHTQHSFPEIGQFFSGRDHSTVMYAVNKITAALEHDNDLNRVVRNLKDNLL